MTALMEIKMAAFVAVVLGLAPAVAAGFAPGAGPLAPRSGAGAILQVQTPPGGAEFAAYRGLLAAVWKGDERAVRREIASGADINVRDGRGRTPLMLAAYRRNVAIAKMLVKAGADLNALDNQRYDVLTISAVAGDVGMLKFAIGAGADPGLTTSPYDGTALIAAAHLGHVEVVKALIDAGAPLDHVNNIGWTALIESIVLGDGGSNHQAVLTALVQAGADVNLADSSGITPLTLARRRGYSEMAAVLEKVGARP